MSHVLQVLNNNHDKKEMERKFHDVLSDILDRVGITGAQHSKPVTLAQSTKGNQRVR